MIAPNVKGVREVLSFTKSVPMTSGEKNIPYPKPTYLDHILDTTKI